MPLRRNTKEKKLKRLGESLAHIMTVKASIERQEAIIRAELFDEMEDGKPLFVEDAGIQYSISKLTAEDMVTIRKTCPLCDHTSKNCRAVNDCYICTREVGHKGNHAACGHNNHNIKQWY